MPSIHIIDQSYHLELNINKDFPEDCPAFAQGYLKLIKQWQLNVKDFEFQTSGSTGKPKKLKFKREQLLESALTSINTFGLSNQQNMFICLPEDFIAGKMMAIRALLTGMDMVLVPPALSPDFSVWKKDKKLVVSLVPPQLEELLDKGYARCLNNKCDQLLLGGGPLAASLEKKIKEHIRFDCYHTFGMTETLTHFAYRKISSRKEAAPVYSIIPPFEVAVSEQQTLMVKGPVTHNQWLFTNDVIQLASTSTFRWLGRKDHVVNSGGIKIHPEQLEEKFRPLLTGQEFFLGGLPHAKWGEQLVLLLESQSDSVDSSALIKHLSTVVDKKLLPKEIIIVEKFQRTKTGKIKRKATLEQWLNQTPSMES